MQRDSPAASWESTRCFFSTRPLDPPRLSGFSLLGYRGQATTFSPASRVFGHRWLDPGERQDTRRRNLLPDHGALFSLSSPVFLMFPFLPGDFWSLVIRFFLKTEALPRNQDFREKKLLRMYTLFLGNHGCLSLSALGVRWPQSPPKETYIRCIGCPRPPGISPLLCSLSIFPNLVSGSDM